MNDPHFENAQAESVFRRVVRAGGQAARRASGPARRAGWQTWAAAGGAGATAAASILGLGGAWWTALVAGLGAALSTLAGTDLARQEKKQ